MEGSLDRNQFSAQIAEIYQHPLLRSPSEESRGTNQDNDNLVTLPTLRVDEQSSAYDATTYKTSSTVARLYEEADQSVVQIVGRRQTFKDGQPKAERVTGSGFFVTPDGKLATVYHVLQNTQDLMVYATDGKAYRAQIERIDKGTDLAILQVERDSTFEVFPVLPLGQSQDSLSPGSSVVALGYPQGWKDLFVSPGTFSKVRVLRDILPEIKGGLIDGENPDRSILENNMHAEGGNSGGPVLDSSGRVVGIVGVSNSENTTEATPVEDLLRLLSQTQQRQHGTGISLASTVPLDNMRPLSVQTPSSYDSLFQLQDLRRGTGYLSNITDSNNGSGTSSTNAQPFHFPKIGQTNLFGNGTRLEAAPSPAHTLFQGVNSIDKLQSLRLATKASVPGGFLSTALGGYDLLYGDYSRFAQSLKTGSSKDIIYNGLQVTADALLIGGGIASMGSRTAFPGAVASLGGSAIKLVTDGMGYTRMLR
ncbi:MAG: trypsin-like peptidase domain-containing protein [Candidatus Melainabacteria bacterium]|nr:trypsin-like peptidase domain-containing protein [Candidatus Melainabacteria bacterium]